MSVDVGAYHLLKPHGGRGMLLGGVPGVLPAKVLILGGGVSGKHAAEMAIGHGADVTLYDISAARLEQLDDQFGGRVKTCYSTHDLVAEALPTADLVIGCVLIPGAAAPKLVTRADLAIMRDGAVLVDVAIDQGGCFETSHPTTHAEPTFVVDGVIHYCVANMPGAAPLTSTYALSAATAPYISALAKKGVEQALAEDPGFAEGLNVQGGHITTRRWRTPLASLERTPGSPAIRPIWRSSGAGWYARDPARSRRLPSCRIEDWYVDDSHLRLRQVSGVGPETTWKLCKKYGSPRGSPADRQPLSGRGRVPLLRELPGRGS